MQLSPKSKLELVVHAVMFELIATMICAPLFAWIMQKPLLQMGALTLIFAFAAMSWNVVYNSVFERIEQAMKWQRSAKIRLLHAMGFEATLIVIIVPLAAWWLNVSLFRAFMLEIGMILFFLPYTFIFNLIYDKLRVRRLQRKSLSVQACEE